MIIYIAPLTDLKKKRKSAAHPKLIGDAFLLKNWQISFANAIQV